MGLLDSFFPQQQGGLLSDPQALLALAGPLLSARKGDNSMAMAVNQGLTTHRANIADERANRQNDMAQISSTYSMLKQQEFQRMLAAKQSGQPYVPNPMLAQLEQKMAALVGAPGLSTGAHQSQQAPQQPQQQPPQPPQSQPIPQAAPQGTPPSQYPMSTPGQQPQAPGVGGPAGGIEAAAWLAADPSGKTYMEQLAKDFMEAQKPVINRGFGIGRMVGGSYVPDKASLDQALAMKRGEMNISQPYETQNVTDASGATHPQFKYQLPGYPGAAPENGAPPSDPQAFLRPKVASKVASLEVTQPSKNDPWATMPKRPVPQGMGQTTFDKSMAENQAGVATKLVEKYGGQADAANQRIALNNQAKDLIDKADNGPKAALIGDVKNWLVSRVGIPESNFENTPSATIALQKDLLNAATQRAKQQFGARITQSEVMLMLQRGSPNVDMTKAAMKYLVDSDNAMSQYAIKQSTDLGRYLQQGGDPNRFEGWHAQAFPASHTLSDVKLNTSKQSGGFKVLGKE